jgi:hypothetical protein
LREAAFLLVAALGLILLFAPEPIIDIVRSVANFWTVGLIFATAGTLMWFVYRVSLRKLWRVRRIANIRLRRILEERDNDLRDNDSSDEPR